MILHRDLKLENVLLTEAPTATERKIYPPPARAAAPEAAATGSTKAEEAAAAAAVSPRPKEEEEEGEGRKEGATPAAQPRPEAKLADFGLAVSFVSPDIATRRSALPRYVSSLASMVLGGGGGAGGGGRGEKGGEGAAAAAAAATAAAAQAQAQAPQDKLGDRRVSAVQAQMLRADAGQAMNDAAVARAASELETALSKWTGAEAAAAPPSSGGGGAAAEPPSSSSTPLAAAAAPVAAAAAGKPAPLATRRVSVSSLLKATNRRVYALTGKTGSYL